MEKQINNFIEFLEKDDGQLLEMMLKDLSDEELSRFLEANPNFIKEMEI